MFLPQQPYNSHHTQIEVINNENAQQIDYPGLQRAPPAFSKIPYQYFLVLGDDATGFSVLFASNTPLSHRYGNKRIKLPLSRNFNKGDLPMNPIVVVVVVAAVLVLAGYISKKRKSPQALSPSQPCEDMQREQETICEAKKDDLPPPSECCPNPDEEQDKEEEEQPHSNDIVLEEREDIESESAKNTEMGAKDGQDMQEGEDTKVIEEAEDIEEDDVENAEEETQNIEDAEDGNEEWEEEEPEAKKEEDG